MLDTPTPEATPPVHTKRVAAASMIGTTVEFYDFYLYATAAVTVFPKLFFPREDATAALLASLATFGLAFTARPVGSVIFGHVGDRIGRKPTLMASLLLMGAATTAIGFLPTYQQAGVIAPALLAVLRFTQGLALGGEWSGAALLATETAAPSRRGGAGVWPQLGAPAGFLLANGLLLALTAVSDAEADRALYQWVWRIPFVLSAVMVAIGLYVRLRLTETPVFAGAVRARHPLAALLRNHARDVVIATLSVTATFTLFYLTTTWTLGYGTAPHGVGLGYARTDFLTLQMLAAPFFALSIFAAGHLIDRYGRKPVLVGTSVGIIVYSALFAEMLAEVHTTHLRVIVFLVVGMILTGLAYGPLSVVLPELFPTSVRYTGSGIAFNVAGVLGAAVAPFVATALTAIYGVAAVGVYLGASAAISCAAQCLLADHRGAALDGWNR